MKRLLITSALLLSLCLCSAKNDAVTSCWVACELSFNASQPHTEEELSAMPMDVVFTNKKTGTQLRIPAFWDGDDVFRVRFAPTEQGVWNYRTECPKDSGLDGKKGRVIAEAYAGDLEIYKHGFVTVRPGKKYLVYSDGTPFFYLGDTHWNYLQEEFDSPGEFAGDLKTDSHFRYIVDKRVSQGFTVYQSEPIGSPFNIEDGRITSEDMPGFREVDRYYRYLADKGMVHANAEFFFSSSMSEKLAKDTAALENISRYWVARFGAYPVMWTLAQEADNDFYFERAKSKFYDYASNPWVKVAEYIHRYDAYSHPLSAHQENVGHTTVTGAGTGSGMSGNGISAFHYEETVKGNMSTGHNWWAAQWSPSLNSSPDMTVARDYWNSPKPAVLYEGRYCYLWTKDFGERVQGWVAFLSGMYGYGYGAIEMWLYKSTYDINSDSNDGIDLITKEEKRTPWSKSIEFPSGYQVGYMKNFLTATEWWKLVPDFNSGNRFAPEEGAAYVCAADGDNTVVVYLYNRDLKSGSVCGLDPKASYAGRWFNPRTGEYLEEQRFSGSSSVRISKPDAQDWTFIIETANKKQ